MVLPRAGVLAIAAAMLLLALPAAAQRPSCVPAGCDPRHPTDACCGADLVAACTEARACKEGPRRSMAECLQEEADCQPRNPGRCTITLECVRGCRDEVRHCASLKRYVRRHAGPCRISLRDARDICRHCAGLADRACPLALAPASPCQKECVTRELINDAITKDCYEKCKARCDDDRCATEICKTACRNAVCNRLRARCTEPETADRPYDRCCGVSPEGCDDDGEETLVCQPTTTSSTSTTSTSTSSTSTLAGQTTSTSISTSTTSTAP